MSKASKKILCIVLVLLLVLGTLVVLIIGNVPQRISLNHQAKSALNRANQNYGEPLKKLGFTDIKQPGVSCRHQPLGGDLECTASLHAQKVFSDDVSKKQLIEAIKSRVNPNTSWGYTSDMQTWFEKALAVAEGYDVSRAKSIGPYLQFKDFGNASCYLEFIIDKWADTPKIKIYAEFRCVAPQQQQG